MGWLKRRRKDDDDCIIRDGRIINVTREVPPGESEARPGLLIREREPPGDPPARVPPETSMKDPDPDNVQIPNPPTAPQYLPCFLIDGSESDLGGFLHYLKYSKITKRYRTEQFINLRLWRRKLEGRLDADSIQRVLVNPSRAPLMMSTLRNYARYRNFHGDPRLLTTLATSMTIRMPKAPEKEAPEVLSDGQLEMYRTQAEKLCRENRRDGVFLGLCLIGVKPSEVSTLKYRNHGTNKVFLKRPRQGALEIDAPGWLVQAMDKIPASEWRRKRSTVLREVREYGTTPMVLLRSVKSVSN